MPDRCPTGAGCVHLPAPHGILPKMACLVCDHSKRYAIETALREGTPKLKVSKLFGIRRQTLQDHVRFKHEEKSPARPPDPSLAPEEEIDPFPTDEQIRRMYSRSERLNHVERLIEERRFFGTETMVRLTRLWRANAVKQDTGLHVAELFAEALKRQTLKRGPKSLRKAFALAELLSLYRVCRDSGDNKTAAMLFGQYIDLDGLKEDPSSYRAILVQIVQFIRTEVPQFAPRVEEHLAQFEIVVDRAKAVLEGEIPQETMGLPEHEGASEAPSKGVEETTNPGIDTGIPRNEEPSSE